MPSMSAGMQLKKKGQPVKISKPAGKLAPKYEPESEESEDDSEEESDEEACMPRSAPTKGKNNVAMQATKAPKGSRTMHGPGVDTKKRVIWKDDEDESEEDEELEDESDMDEEDEDDEELEDESDEEEERKVTKPEEDEEDEDEESEEESDEDDEDEEEEVTVPSKKFKTNEGDAKPRHTPVPMKLDQKIQDEISKSQEERNKSSLFFKNVPKNTSDAMMKALSPDIISIKWKLPTRRYGWLSFANERICKKNYEKLKNAKIGDTAIFIDLCTKKPQSLEKDDVSVDALKLYVGNLPNSTTEDDLKRLFPMASMITKHLIKRGFAFVTFASPENAQQAFKANKNASISGNQIFVSFARLNEKRTQQQQMKPKKRQFEKVESQKETGKIQKKNKLEGGNVKKVASKQPVGKTMKRR